MAFDLRSRLRPQIAKIESCSKYVKKDIALAIVVSDRKEHEFQEEERKLAAKHRKQFSIFESQTTRKLESYTEWQLRTDQELLSKDLLSFSDLPLIQ